LLSHLLFTPVKTYIAYLHRQSMIEHYSIDNKFAAVGQTNSNCLNLIQKLL
jgi:hypothetical protein